MKAWHLSLLLLMLMVLAFGSIVTRESFVVAANDDIPLVNQGPEPWERHQIISTPYLQLQPAYQRGIRHHANAAYFEVDNHTFDIALQKAFAFSCTLPTYTDKGWSADIPINELTAPAELREQYPQILKFLSNKLRASTHLKGVQIVHDRWLTYQRSASNSKMFLVTIEVLLYRTGKFQGKHVVLTIFVNLNKDVKDKFTVVASRVEGVIAEDQIGMHPVTPKQPIEYVNVPKRPMDNYAPILLTEQEVKRIEREQREKLNRNLSAQLLII